MFEKECLGHVHLSEIHIEHMQLPKEWTVASYIRHGTKKNSLPMNRGFFQKHHFWRVPDCSRVSLEGKPPAFRGFTSSQARHSMTGTWPERAAQIKACPASWGHGATPVMHPFPTLECHGMCVFWFCVRQTYNFFKKKTWTNYTIPGASAWNVYMWQVRAESASGHTILAGAAINFRLAILYNILMCTHTCGAAT